MRSSPRILASTEIPAHASFASGSGIGKRTKDVTKAARRGDSRGVNASIGPSPEDAGESRKGASDEEWRRLFATLAAGDPSPLEALYDLSARRIFGLALWRTGSAEDAGEVVQEVFLRLARDPRRLDRVTHPEAWLLGVAHHVAADLSRRRRRRESAPLDDVPFLAAPAVDESRAIDARRASRFLAQLPPAQRTAIYLKHFAGCTFAAIARMTGVPAFTAASRYRLGIGKLRRLMEVSR
jgi:RNA polymerase sigma-70 factor, ECF subfamily